MSKIATFIDYFRLPQIVKDNLTIFKNRHTINDRLDLYVVASAANGDSNWSGSGCICPGTIR